MLCDAAAHCELNHELAVDYARTLVSDGLIVRCGSDQSSCFAITEAGLGLLVP